MRRALVFCALIGCGSVEGDTPADTGVAKDVGIDCSTVGCAAPPPCGMACTAVCGCCPNTMCGDTGTAATTITGTIDGKPVDPAVRALWIGMPDDPSQTVLYVFNKPIECIDISTSGWDARLPMGTQFFEIIAGDTVPATYAVASMPGKLQATVTFSYAGGMMPTEKVGSSGKVVIDAFTMSAHAVGTFDVTVTGGALKGSFDATSCASGREP